jgi:protein phosphatase 1 regulatory subunit 7
MTTGPVKYTVEKRPYGPNLVLNGPWSDSLLPLFETEFSGLWVNHVRGFRGDNLEFLEKLPRLKSLTLIVQNIRDLSPLNSLHELRYLNLDESKPLGLDFGCLPGLEYCGFNWHRDFRSIYNCISLQTIYVQHYDGIDVSRFSNLKSLERLKIGNSPLKSLTGLGELISLRRLGLYGLRVLSDISALGERPEITALDIECCRKLGNIDAVSQLKCLERFGLSNCGDIASLKPISNLHKLILMGFFDTNIVDGDLSPLVGLPNLGFTLFRNKKHYTHKYADFSQKFQPTPWI